MAHKCNSCLFIICQNCLTNIFNGKININFHPHKLKLKYNNQKWICNKCEFIYSLPKCISLYCEQCNQNFCDICYLSQNNEQMQNNNKENNNGLHEHSLKYILLNDICVFCCARIFNKMGYTCESCNLILCENCYEKIFINDDNANNLHKHNLILKFRNDWSCDICKRYYKNKYSCFCESCDFDVCYKCYYNLDNKGEKDNEINDFFNEIEKTGKMVDECIPQ